MAFDLFSLDILDEDVARFRSYTEWVVIEGSRLQGSVALVPNESYKLHSATCYTPEEARYLLSLSDEEAEKVHHMKRVMGGHIKPK